MEMLTALLYAMGMLVGFDMESRDGDYCPSDSMPYVVCDDDYGCNQTAYLVVTGSDHCRED